MISRCCRLAFTPALCLWSLAPSSAGEGPGRFIQAFRLVQGYGTPEALDPANDARVKGTLYKALGKQGLLTARGVNGLIDPAVFEKLAGADGVLDEGEISQALEAAVPETRERLNPAVLAHADLLSTSFDRIDGPQREAARALADWVVTHHKPGAPLDVTVICTGNSRRSILGATMGNVAASYYGFPEVRFHSGGTAPTAFNPRTVAALRAIGIAIESTGREAPRGEPGTPNPVYRVRWGASDAPGLEAAEFSKTYSDPGNPQTGFAALLVCGEADVACPAVRGASVRIAMPLLDPKVFDDSPYEVLKYAERRDDLGRLMLSAMAQARRRLADTEPTTQP